MLAIITRIQSALKYDTYVLRVLPYIGTIHFNSLKGSLYEGTWKDF
jgi:hypothetical protein